MTSLPSIGFHRKIRQKSLENTIYGVCAAERPNIVLKCPCIQLGSCHVAHTAYMGIFRHSHSILCVARAVGNLMDGKLLKAKIAVALQDELGRVPKEEEINQVFLMARVMYKAILGLHYKRKEQKKQGQLAIF